MVIDILNYSTSILSSLLKIITPLIFLVAVYFLFETRKRFGGVFRDISTLLLIAAAGSVVAHGFRFVGGVMPSQWKWGESTFYLITACVTFYAAYQISQKLRRVSQGE